MIDRFRALKSTRGIRPANAEGTGKKACRLMRESPPTALGPALSFRTETRHLPSQAAQRKDTTSCPDRVAAAAPPSSVMNSRRFTLNHPVRERGQAKYTFTSVDRP